MFQHLWIDIVIHKHGIIKEKKVMHFKNNRNRKIRQYHRRFVQVSNWVQMLVAIYLCGCKRSRAFEMLPSTVSNNWVNQPPSLLNPIAVIAMRASLTRASVTEREISPNFNNLILIFNGNYVKKCFFNCEIKQKLTWMHWSWWWSFGRFFTLSFLSNGLFGSSCCFVFSINMGAQQTW